MKVLVIWYKNFEYLDSIVNAFKANKVQADKFIIEYFNDSANNVTRVADKLLFNHKLKHKHSQKMRDSIIQKCDYEGIDNILILTGDFVDVLNNEFFSWANKTKKNLVLWFVDSARNFNCFSKEYFSNFKKIYSFEPLDIKYLQSQYGVDDVGYLPLTAATEIYNADKELEKKYDVCFVGVGSDKRSQILEQVARYCIDNNKKMIVYGQFWRFRPFYHKFRYKIKFKKQYPYLYNFVINKFIRPKMVAEVYKQSRICLNIVQNTQTAANPRTFEIIATKSFQIIDYHEHIEDLFEDKKELVMYKDAKELISLIDYYLKNENNRQEIAQRGYEKVQKKFVLKETVNTIITDNF